MKNVSGRGLECANNRSREFLNILRRATDMVMTMAKFVMLVCDKLTHTHTHAYGSTQTSYFPRSR